MTSKFHLLNPHNHPYHPHFIMEKLRSINKQTKKAGWEGWDPAGQTATWLPCALSCPLNLPRGTERGRSLTPPPSCWLAGHEGTDWIRVRVGDASEDSRRDPDSSQMPGDPEDRASLSPQIGDKAVMPTAAVKGHPPPYPPWRAREGRVQDSETWITCARVDCGYSTAAPHCSKPLLLF